MKITLSELRQLVRNEVKKSQVNEFFGFGKKKEPILDPSNHRLGDDILGTKTNENLKNFLAKKNDLYDKSSSNELRTQLFSEMPYNVARSIMLSPIYTHLEDNIKQVISQNYTDIKKTNPTLIFLLKKFLISLSRRQITKEFIDCIEFTNNELKVSDIKGVGDNNEDNKTLVGKVLSKLLTSFLAQAAKTKDIGGESIDNQNAATTATGDTLQEYRRRNNSNSITISELKQLVRSELRRYKSR